MKVELDIDVSQLRGVRTYRVRHTGIREPYVEGTVQIRDK